MGIVPGPAHKIPILTAFNQHWYGWRISLYKRKQILSLTLFFFYVWENVTKNKWSEWTEGRTEAEVKYQHLSDL